MYAKTNYRSSCLALCALVLATVALPTNAFASLENGDNIVTFFDHIVGIFTGNLGKGLATLAIISLGLMALFSRIEWKTAIFVGVGVSAMFGAANIYQTFKGVAGWDVQPTSSPSSTATTGGGGNCPDTSSCTCGTNWDASSSCMVCKSECGSMTPTPTPGTCLTDSQMNSCQCGTEWRDSQTCFICKSCDTPAPSGTATTGGNNCPDTSDCECGRNFNSSTNCFECKTGCNNNCPNIYCGSCGQFFNSATSCFECKAGCTPGTPVPVVCTNDTSSCECGSRWSTEGQCNVCVPSAECPPPLPSGYVSVRDEASCPCGLDWNTYSTAHDAARCKSVCPTPTPVPTATPTPAPLPQGCYASSADCPCGYNSQGYNMYLGCGYCQTSCPTPTPTPTPVPLPTGWSCMTASQYCRYAAPSCTDGEAYRPESNCNRSCKTACIATMTPTPAP